MIKLNYTVLERYSELVREAEGCLAGIINAAWGAYPDNSQEPRGLDAKGYAVELRAIAIELEREVRRLDAMTPEEVDSTVELATQEAGL